ncbi:hypothetical protein D3C77_442780 [compost metagenome]
MPKQLLSIAVALVIILLLFVAIAPPIFGNITVPALCKFNFILRAVSSLTVFMVFKMNLSFPSRFISLTLQKRISKSSRPCSLIGNPFPVAHIPISPKRVITHPSGNSNGLSSSLISGKALGFLIFPSFTSRPFSAAMRSNSTEAGSSQGSCGTNLPRTASSRISSRSFLMPVSSSLLLLPRPALLLGRTAALQRSRWSVIRFSLAIMPAPLAWPHLCPRRRPEWLLAGHAGSGFQPVLWHSAPAALQGHGLSAHPRGGF